MITNETKMQKKNNFMLTEVLRWETSSFDCVWYLNFNSPIEISHFYSESLVIVAFEWS